MGSWIGVCLCIRKDTMPLLVDGVLIPRKRQSKLLRELSLNLRQEDLNTIRSCLDNYWNAVLIYLNRYDCSPTFQETLQEEISKIAEAFERAGYLKIGRQDCTEFADLVWLECNMHFSNKSSAELIHSLDLDPTDCITESEKEKVACQIKGLMITGILSQLFNLPYEDLWKVKTPAS